MSIIHELAANSEIFDMETISGGPTPLKSRRG